MRALPPGPTFLLRRLNFIVVAPASLFTVTYAARRLFGVVVPWWLLVICTFCSIPLVFIVYNASQERRNRNKAHALGATMPTEAKLNSAMRALSEKKYFRTLALSCYRCVRADVFARSFPFRSMREIWQFVCTQHLRYEEGTYFQLIVFGQS